jgi:ABC-type sugar transport system ATPase subunit
LAGLVGSGRAELLEALFGLRATASASIELDGAPYTPASPTASIAKGIGFVPPDRKSQGLLLAMSVAENLTIVATSSRARIRRPERRTERDAVAEARTAMHIRAGSDRVPVGTLSGGNQQKVALGKWLAGNPRLLLLDEPTRGVDVAAKAEIHGQLREAADRGLAMLVSSSEYDELLTLCARIVVMFRGRVVAVLTRDQATEARLAALAGGET